MVGLYRRICRWRRTSKQPAIIQLHNVSSTHPLSDTYVNEGDIQTSKIDGCNSSYSLVAESALLHEVWKAHPEGFHNQHRDTLRYQSSLPIGLEDLEMK